MHMWTFINAELVPSLIAGVLAYELEAKELCFSVISRILGMVVMVGGMKFLSSQHSFLENSACNDGGEEVDKRIRIHRCEMTMYLSHLIHEEANWKYSTLNKSN